MAERRMFAKSVVLSDAFLDMPGSARSLYFMLGMLADDDGVVSNPKSIMRQCGASEDDLKLLYAKRYLLCFESGVAVIKHWKMNNYVPKDRYRKTSYTDEINMLIVDERNAYTEKEKSIKDDKIDTELAKIEEETTEVPENSENSEQNQVYTECIQNVYNFPKNVDTGKDRLGKDSIDKSSSSIKLSYDNNSEKKITASDDRPKYKLQPVYDELQHIFPFAATSWITAIDLYKDKLTNDLIIHAIKETASSGVNSPKYFKAICERYILNGYKSVSEIDDISKLKNKNARAKPIANKMTRDEYNEWFKENILSCPEDKKIEKVR